MTLNQIRYFLEVCQTGNLSKYARDNYVSVQSVSKAICSLEKELGVTLFLRTATGLKLTREGEIACRRFRQALDLIDNAPLAFADYATELSERLSICFAYGVFKSVGTEVLNPFKEKYPNVTLSLEDAVDADAEARLADGSVDVLLSCGPFESGSFEGGRFLTFPLKTERMYSIIHKDHPLYGREFSLSELLDYELLVMPEGFRYRLPADRLSKQCGKPVRFGFCSYQFDLLKEMSENNQGIFTIPESSIPPRNPDVEYVPFPDPSYVWSVYVSMAEWNTNPAAWAFVEQCSAQFCGGASLLDAGLIR